MSSGYPITTPTSFDHVVSIYNSITPIKGKNAPYDIRPLGRRTNHDERIIKIDDNNYAFWPSTHWWMKIETFDKEEARIRAAILWERTDKGDFVHVRNGWFTAANITHFRFLWEALPYGLAFGTQNGKQYIIRRNDLTKHYLPKDKWMGGTYSTAFKSFDKNGPTTPELVFQHKGNDQFTLVSEPYTAPRKVVDKEAKAELRNDIKAFREWALVMAPMLNLKPTWSWPYTKQEEALNTAYVAQRRTDEETVGQWGLANGYGRIGIQHIPPKITRQIMQNEQHPLRVVLASFILNACDLRRIEQNVKNGSHTEKEAKTKFLNAFNYHMNQVLGLVEEK